MRTLAVAFLLTLPSIALAQDAPLPPPPSPEPTGATLVEALVAARDAESGERGAAVERVLALTPSAEDVLAALESLPAPATHAGWQVLMATGADGVARPYHLYVPALATEPEEGAAPPLLIDMHGGVSRPEFIGEEQFKLYRDTWTELADEYGFVVAMPLGRADCMWWSDAGVGHVRAVIRDVLRRAEFDTDRIVGTGFSDGGSGCFYLAMAAPEPFAALMPMNGHPMVAVGASQRQLYLRNAAQLPLFVCMTQDDGLYPAQTVLPHVQALIQSAAQVHLVSYPTGGHSPSYFEDQSEAFMGFLHGARRDPLPDRFEWATAHVETGRAHWAEVLEIGAADRDIAAEQIPDIQVMSVPGRVRIGIGVDREYAGKGVRVTTVDEKRPAGALGLKEGDILIGVDDVKVANLSDLREVLGKKQFGDELVVEIIRHGDPETGEPILASTTIPPFTAEPSYARDRATAWFSLSRTGNTVRITAHGVRRLRLHLSSTEFDLAKPVTVIVNGIERAHEQVAPDVRQLIECWAADADPARLFVATLDVTIPAPRSSK